MVSAITVITASIPERSFLLSQNVDCVHRQTVHVPHLIRTHPMEEEGNPAFTYNFLAKCATTSHIQLCDDDNYLLPHHIETITPYLDDFDVIYTYDALKTRPRTDIRHLNSAELIEFFRVTNTVDQSSCIRRSLYRKIGGMRAHDKLSPGLSWPDQDLWYRLAAAGARFKCVPEETWVYRTRPYSEDLIG